MNVKRRTKKSRQVQNDVQPSSAELYLQLMQAMMAELVMLPEMTIMPWRLLAWILSNTEWGNTVPINQSALARQFNKSRMTIARALKTLITMKVLLRIERPGTHPEYMLNPAVGIKARNGDERARLRQIYWQWLDAAEDVAEQERPRLYQDKEL